MNSKQFMVGGDRWAAIGTVTRMDFPNTLSEGRNVALLCEWNFQTVCISQKGDTFTTNDRQHDGKDSVKKSRL